MKRFSIFATCVCAVLLAASVFAQNQQGQSGPRQRGGLNGEKRVKRMDANNDGAISREEWKGKPQAFDAIDKNNDGSLSREELSATVQRQVAGRLNQMDANNDGRISRDEWKGPEKRFNRLDANSDGVITKEEIRSLRRNRPKLEGRG